jgi:hypothetical protein
MKKLIIIALLINLSSFAQIKGNKQIETKTFALENVETIKINFYAKVTIDQAAKEGITITTDSNLFDLIGKEVVDGTLSLDQLKWISSSKKTIITIGAPNLKRVETGTHDQTKIVNINKDYLNITALLGTVSVEGKVKQLIIDAEQGSVNASKLAAKNVRVNIWGRGSATVNVVNVLEAKLSEDAKLKVIGTPKKLIGDAKKGIEKSNNKNLKSLNWISFKIKNNSWNRNQFYVVGPKKDGSRFSYGFPMMPGISKKERWTVGTKVYKVNKIGLRKLLVKIKAEDAGKTVKLFD